MKKAVIFFSIILLVVASGFSQKFSLKVGAGLGYASGGDVAGGIQGQMDYLKDQLSPAGEFAVPRFGLSFSAELIYHFRPKLGIGLGLGYFSCGKESRVTYTIDTASVSQSLHPSIAVVPVTATFHYYPARSSKIKLDLGAGFGLYLAHLNYKDLIDITASGQTGSNEYTFASGRRLGFGLHLGVSAEYPLSSKSALVAGVLGRFVSVTLSSGEWTEKGSGLFGDYNDSGNDHKAWYFDWTSGAKTYPQIFFRKDAPTGGDVANVRQAKLGLTGFLFSLGIRIGV